MGLPAGPWYINDLMTWTVNLHTVTTGAATDGDSAPTYNIYEDETTTAILSGTMALLNSASTTGFYSEQVTLSAANGFEVGKSYAIYVVGIVNGVTATQSFNFKPIATPTASLDAAGIRAAVGLASANLDTQLTAIDDAVDTEVAAVLAAVDTEVAAIKTKTDFLPSATAGAAGGLFIAGTNAATTITTSFTTTFTGNLTGSVASVTGAVGSVTGNVGGSVGTVNAFAANSITAAATAADYVTEVQSGLATAAALATIDDFVDTEVAAIKVVTDKLDTALELDGAVYRYTTNALEQAPTGGSAPTAAQNATELLDQAAGVETGLTVRQALRLSASALFGKASGLGTTTAIYRDFGDTKARLTATVDADGNRTAITRDAT